MKILFSFPFLLIYLLIVVSVCWWYGYKRTGLTLIAGIIVSLYLVCTPLMTRTLLQLLGEYPPLLQADRLTDQGYQAIVVLSGGFYQGLEMNSQPQAGGYSLTRLRYAAHLARTSQLPILISGVEAPAMASTLIQDFGLEARWQESLSEDTDQNARFTAEMLGKLGLKKIVLVTDVWHMGRSQMAFAHYGVHALAAPTDFPSGFFKEQPGLFAPRAILFPMNLFGLSECLGQIKYRVQYWWADL